MTPVELIRLLDSGMVEELKMYYNGQKTVVDIHNIPAIMPDYEVSKIWNSEDGKGISVLLADNMGLYPVCSLCGGKQDVKSNYCPDCGAKMRGEEE